MKQDVVIFQRQTMVSNSDGTAKTYRHDQNLCRALGSSSELLLHFIGDRRSSSDTTATIKVYQKKMKKHCRKTTKSFLIAAAAPVLCGIPKATL